MEIIENGQYNIGHICTRMQCDRGLGEKIAMRFLSQELEACDYSFLDLERESNRFANALGALGIGEGEVCFTFVPKAPEQFFAILGALKARLITGTLFANFGEEALLDRLGDAQARVILTRRSLLKRILALRGRLPALRFIIVTDAQEHLSEEVLSYRLLTREASDVYQTPITPPQTPSLLHYTSGSTGKPKGVLHVHQSVLSQSRTAREVLQLSPEDRYWCTADQGWVTGTSYGIIGPWSLGVTQVHFAGGYHAQSWLTVLERERVSVWYTAPTALRMLMREEPEFLAGFDLGSLRHIFSVGEPLNPEVINWARQTLGKEIYDTWFQTETGAIMIANRPGLAVREGSMGQPVSGVFPAVLDAGGAQAPAGEQGDLCLQEGWPSMFAGYLNNERSYRSKFRGGFYFTGDTAYRDREGYYWFMGRSDDIINSAGHLVSPFEVESALIELPEIAESGVVGAPDQLLYEKVVAFVVLHRGIEPTPELELKIRLRVTHRVSSFASPQEIRFVAAIPKNKSGKIMRRVLRSNYLGLDAGDTSTMEI